jgi:putative ABC transport system ATP-binding protein
VWLSEPDEPLTKLPLSGSCQEFACTLRRKHATNAKETGSMDTHTQAAAAARPALSARAAHAVAAVKVYGHGETTVRALDGVTLDLAAGFFTAIMGPSGSGKSTLLHCLAALDGLSSGQVFLGGTELGALDDKSLTLLRRERIGFIFQSFNLLPALTAIDNITLPLRIRGQRPDPAWIDHLVGIVGLRERLRHRPAELSGGEQQRVAAVRALASRPEIVYADEPTGNLDRRTTGDLLTFLRRAVTEFGQTVVMVTHDPVAAAFADRVVFLADGRVAGQLAEPTGARVLDALKDLEA